MAADVLSQLNKKGNLHPMIFFSSKMSLEKCNYKIYDKEILIIVKTFKEWHFKTYGTADSVIMLINHKNLKYFITTHKLNHHQACWNEFLSEFNFNIIYQPEAINSVTDALTHHAGNCLCNKKNSQNAHQYQIILEGQQLQLNIFNVYDSDTVNVITVISVIFQSQKHNLQSIMKNSDDKNFIINFN